MRRSVVTAALVVAAAIVVIEARAIAAPQFRVALAAQTATPASTLAPSAAPAETGAPAPAPVTTAPPAVTAQAATIAPLVTTSPTVKTAPPVPATPAPTVAAAAPVPTSTPAAPTCQAGAWFCYPRLGIGGAIVPYADCTGTTDVGTQIRSFTCLSDHYLMGHAYTQFGKITAWQAGDVVFAYGRPFTVTGAFVQSACTQPHLPLAPLEMQTSLTPSACGDVLVVQAH